MSLVYIPFTQINAPSTNTLSLHDALPIFLNTQHGNAMTHRSQSVQIQNDAEVDVTRSTSPPVVSGVLRVDDGSRSEEHTSELQSPYDLVCRLLLEKKNNSHQAPISVHLTI